MFFILFSPYKYFRHLECNERIGEGVFWGGDYFKSAFVTFRGTLQKNLAVPNSPATPSWKWSSFCWRELLLYTSTQSLSGGNKPRDLTVHTPAMPSFDLFLSLFFPISALIKQVNKSIDGTADDEEEGVPTDEAIRAGLELLKVKRDSYSTQFCLRKKY